MADETIAVAHLKRVGFVIREKRPDGVLTPKSCIKDLGTLVDLDRQEFDLDRQEFRT